MHTNVFTFLHLYEKKKKTISMILIKAQNP